MFYLYFGVASGEAATEGGGWLLSDWKKFQKDQVYHLKFNQPNGILLFDIIAPFDCEVDAIYLSSVSQKCVFCIKGAFNAVKDNKRYLKTKSIIRYFIFIINPHVYIKFVK